MLEAGVEVWKSGGVEVFNRYGQRSTYSARSALTSSLNSFLYIS
jgi:hypothetical protein